MFGRERKLTPMSNEEFLSTLSAYASHIHWTERKYYADMKNTAGGLTLGNARLPLGLGYSAKILYELSTPETIHEEREIFAEVLRRSASRIESNRGYSRVERRDNLREAKRERKLAERVLLYPQELT